MDSILPLVISEAVDYIPPCTVDNQHSEIKEKKNRYYWMNDDETKRKLCYKLLDCEYKREALNVGWEQIFG